MQLPRSFRALLVLGITTTAGACESLLEVDNPNNVTDDDIRSGVAAEVLTNGALYTVMGGWDEAVASYATISDEIRSIGPWGHSLKFDQGKVDDRNNSHTSSLYRRLAQGRWMADEAIAILDSLSPTGDLGDLTLLARSYFYGAIAYASIADFMDDFTLSDRTVAGPAIGPENMGGLYDTAITYLTNALAFDNDTDFRRNTLALRARVRHAAAMWDQIGQVPIALVNNGLVSNQSAVQDANSALAEDATDWRYEFDFHTPSDGSTLAWRLNSALPDYRFGNRYVVGEVMDAAVVLLDPIDSIPDPWLERFALEELFAVGVLGFVNLTVFSAREMHLIIAEDALARGDTTTFAAEINDVRSYDGLTEWSTASPISALDMLIHQRRVNLFLQGRRLHDMYRFGIKSDNWETSSTAYTTPGTFFPIPITEIEANCHLNPDVECP